jgi:hypothetical protein
MFRGGNRGRRQGGRENRTPRVTPPDYGYNQGSRKSSQSLIEPKKIDYVSNSITRHHDWAMLQKEFIKYFTEHFEYFVDIIVTGQHHVFPPRTSMTREEDQQVVDIVPNE